MDNLDTFLFIVLAGFVASFIDSIVGGGGMISLPSLLLTGLPPAIALGTNKMSSVMGSLTSSLSFLRSGQIDKKLIFILFPIDFLGSILGAYTVHLLSPIFLKPLVIIMLVIVTVYTFSKKDWGLDSSYEGITRKNVIASGLAAFVLGFYDGFFGPGTGSFLLFYFLTMGFDFVMAAGNAKALNFASNIGACISFYYLNLIYLPYALPMGLASIAGALLGSQVAIRKGAAYIKPLFFLISSLLIGKQIWDLFSGK